MDACQESWQQQVLTGNNAKDVPHKHYFPSMYKPEGFVSLPANVRREEIGEGDVAAAYCQLQTVRITSSFSATNSTNARPTVGPLAVESNAWLDMSRGRYLCEDMRR